MWSVDAGLALYDVGVHLRNKQYFVTSIDTAFVTNEKIYMLIFKENNIVQQMSAFSIEERKDCEIDLSSRGFQKIKDI